MVFSPKKLKAIHIIFLAAIGVSAVLLTLRTGTRASSTITPVRIPYAYEPGDVHLDPREIRWSFEYDFVNNLFGMLLRRNKNNDLVIDLPDRMQTRPNSATFFFSEKAKTSKGTVLTAKDAAYSIKRLFMRDDQRYVWVRRVICSGKMLKNITEECAGLKFDLNSLTLTVNSPSDLPMLLSALSSPDFGIAPAYQIDPISGDLSKTASSDTSGPYFLKQVNAAGEMEFEANTNNYLLSPHTIKTIRIVPGWSADSIRKFLKNELEILPMDTYWGSPEAKTALENPNFHVYETLPSRVSVVQFTKTGLKNFTPAERIYVGNKIAEANSKLHPQPGAKPTAALLQSFSDGALSKSQLAEISANRALPLKSPISKRLKFGIAKRDFDKMKELLKDSSEIEVVPYPSHPSDSPESEWPDAMTMVADVSANDVLSMITSYLNTLLFVPELNQNDWLQKFVSTPDREVRSDLLRELHFKSLRNGSVVPIVATPYFAMTTANLSFEANKVQPTMDMWTIRRE